MPHRIRSDRPSTPLRGTLLAVAACLAVGACQLQVNDDIIIPAGSERMSGASTVNGDVLVGESAVVRSGRLRSVNGDVKIDSHARVGAVATVNGEIRIGPGAATGHLETVNGAADCAENARVGGDVRLVNGAVKLRQGAVVQGNVETVNGAIRLYGATVEGSVGNYNGGMTITDGSVVQGDLVVRDSTPGNRSESPRIVIGPGSRVVGELRFERPVRLYVHDTAEVGPITGAEALPYTGAAPGDG